MKTTTLVLILFLTGLDLWAQTPRSDSPGTNVIRRLPARFLAATNTPSSNQVAPSAPSAAPAAPAPTPVIPQMPVPPTNPSVPSAPAPSTVPPTAPAASEEEIIPPGTIDFEGVDINQVLDVYCKFVGRTMLRAGLPSANIVLHTQTPLTRSEVIQALQAVLALNGVALINIGDKFVKAVPSGQANQEGAPFNEEEAAQLPDIGQYVTHIVQLKYVKPSEMVQVIQPFAKLNSIIALDGNGILVIRDYAENVKRMLEMIEKVDVNVPAEYVSEVIPIKYALAGDISSALSSLGGGGNIVSVGASGANQPISGINTRPGGTGTPGTAGYQSGGFNGSVNQPRTFGQQATTGPGGAAAGSTFGQRLQSIIQRAAGGGQDQIQLFGQTKIIADQRSNSLLVYATRQDMETIKHIISQLDVLLSQVLIEAVIIDYELGPNQFSFGVSAAQSPQLYSGSAPGGVPTANATAGAGGVNNGQSFLNLFNLPNNGMSNNAFGNILGGGLSYFGNIGPRWDVALSAAASDSHASIIQRPRIQTSQAKPAQFFVGQTIPYVTSTYNYGGINGNQSSYSQLSVGVELDVTPFINPDGLVVMDVQQEIDDVIPGSGQNVGGGVTVPETDKRTLSSEIAVRNGDTVMLGGFIKNQKTANRSGVPFLQDIPLLGNLFSSRSNSKQREELIVMMRPTVLKTPEIAAEQTVKEEERLPGISRTEAEDASEERKQIKQNQKLLFQERNAMTPDEIRAYGNPTNAPDAQQ